MQYLLLPVTFHLTFIVFIKHVKGFSQFRQRAGDFRTFGGHCGLTPEPQQISVTVHTVYRLVLVA